MRHLHTILTGTWAACMLALAAGCGRDLQPSLETLIGSGTEGPETLTARIEDASKTGTKTAYGSTDGKFDWTEGDQIAVHTTNGYVTASVDPATGKVTGIPAGALRDYYAVYPASAAVATNYGNSELQVTYPGSYDISDIVSGSSTARTADYSPCPMVAGNAPESDALLFRHVGGLIRVTLKAGIVPAPTYKVRVIFDKDVTGTYTVANPASTGPAVTTGGTLSNNIVTFILAGNSHSVGSLSSDVTLNIPVPCGTYEGFTLEFLDYGSNDNGTVLSSEVCTRLLTLDRRHGKRISISPGAEKPVTRFTPLTIEPLQDGTTITIDRPNGFTYSKDGGITKYPLSGKTISANAGEQVSLYHNGNLNLSASSGPPARAIIDFDQDCYVYGNIMSLTSVDDYYKTTTTDSFGGLFYNNTHLLFHPDKKLLLPATSVQSWGYAWMFAGCTGIEDIPEDFLPATTLAYACYQAMFDSCTGLKSLPDGFRLPATNLANSCYNGMFARSGLQSLPPGLLSAATALVNSCYAYMFGECTDLKSLPKGLLPAMVAKDHCYSAMFKGCTGLESLPEDFLPAPDLEECCYYMMFEDCSNLRTVPSGLLPATSLADGCYMFMFQNCSSLTKAPHLPATTPKTECYRWLFDGCTSLTEVSCNLSSFAATNCVQYMLNLPKTSTGVFKKNTAVSDATWRSYGVPTGWTFGTYGQ